MKRKDIDIITVLLDNKDKKLNITDISKELDMDYKNTYQIVSRLEKNNIISIEKIGNTKICSLINQINPSVFKAESKRRKKLLKNKHIKFLFKKLQKLNFPFIALVFGSFAKKTSKKGSDIDLLTIAEEKRKNEIENAATLIPKEVHLTVLTYNQFLDMLKSKEFSVVSEAVKNNVLLIGIEEYYRLLNNAY